MAAQFNTIAARRIQDILDARTLDEPIIALHGPRSVGKSTLLRMFADARNVDVIDLDDPSVRDAVVANSAQAVGGPTPNLLG